MELGRGDGTREGEMEGKQQGVEWNSGEGDGKRERGWEDSGKLIWSS